MAQLCSIAKPRATKYQLSWPWPFKIAKGKSHGSIKLPIYGFLLLFNSNISPNWAPFRDTSYQKLSDFDFGLLGSLKVKYIAIGLPYMISY